jgi:serine protease
MIPVRISTWPCIGLKFLLVGRRSAAHVLLAAGLGLSVQIAKAMPWHLGIPSDGDASVQSLSARPEVAPAAINTAGIAPGPYPVVVAVIDSGVLAEHPSLEGRLLPGYDMQSLPANIRGGRSSNFAPDPLGTRCAERAVSGAYRTHGTEVASLVAGNGKEGVFGVNPKAQIVPIRLMGACGMSRADLIDAISWAAGLPVQGVPDNPHPARIINLSLAGGSNTCNSALQKLINKLTDQGVFLVAAAGNNFHKPLFEPANCQGVISVGAVDAENRIEAYSALDSRTVVYAPGGGKQLQSRYEWAINKLRVATIELDFLGRERPAALYRGVGTSFAAPIVAGFVSLWLSYQPKGTPSNFISELPRFLREVEAHEKCPDCKPKGLAASMKLVKP